MAWRRRGRKAWTAALAAVALAVAGGVAGCSGGSGSGGVAVITGLTAAEQGGAPNLAEDQVACSPLPVNCATGVLWEQHTDFLVPGIGIPLFLTRTYVSADASRPSAFGYGWTGSYLMSLTAGQAGTVTVRQEDGAAVTFRENARHRFTAPVRVMATLTRNRGGGYTFTRDSDQVRFTFSRSGRLIAERDTDGDTTTLRYAGSTLVAVTDATGRTLRFGYQGQYLTAVTAPMGATEQLSYAGGNLVSVTDPGGRTWQYGYQGHLLTSVTDPRGLVTTIRYDASRRVSELRDPGQADTAWRYAGDGAGPAGGMTTVTGPDGAVMRYRYAGLELTSVTAGAGSGTAMTSYTRNAQTLVTSVTNPDGHVTSYAYDRAGDLLASTDPLGRTTRYAYNAYGEVTSKALPSGATTRNWYDSNGNLTRTQDGAGNVTTYARDPAHPSLVAKVTAPGGRVTAFTYDAHGDTATTTTSPRPGVTDTTRYAYDAAGNLTCEASPDAVARHIGCPAPGQSCPVPATPHTMGTTSYGINCDGQVTTITDPGGNTTSYTHDGDGDLSTVTDPEGNVTSYAYSPYGQRASVTRNGIVISATTFYDSGNVKTRTDGPGQVTRYAYDSLGRVISTTDALGHLARYSYDPAGNLAKFVNPSGQATYYTYDAANELTAVSYNAGSVPAINYAYTADGQSSQVSDAAGTTTYTYDADHRLLSATQATPEGTGSSYSYAYNDQGNTVALSYPNGQLVTDRYDTSGQLTAVLDWLGDVITFHYDASGNLTSEDAPGIRTIYGPNSVIIAHQNSDLAVFAYARNKAGLIAKTAAQGVPRAPAKVITYAYTKRGALAAVGNQAYGYDPAGNLASSSAGFAQDYNAAGELATRTASGTTTTYGYDPEGNRTTVAAPGQPATSLGYDPANWLTSITSPSLTASYAYNGDGLLTSATVNGAQTSLTWDQAQSEPLLLSTTSGTGSAGGLASPSPSPSPSSSAATSATPSASTVPGASAPPSGSASPSPSVSPSLPLSDYVSYLYGPGGQPIEQIAGRTPAFLLADQQGSIRLLTNVAGREVGAISYGPYGTVTGRTGTVTSALGYDGQYTDPRTGYIYLRARYYDPATGQFLTRDPDVALTGAPYSYAGNDPVNASDPLGLSWWNPFTWSAKTWAGVGIGALLGLGAIFTDGADLALAPEALGLDAADTLGVSAADALGADAVDGTLATTASDTGALGSEGAAPALKFTAPGDGFGEYASRADPIGGYQDVIVHGSPDSFAATPTSPSFSASDLADMITRNPGYKGGPIRLISCNTGAPGATAAQDLANALGVEVMAPDDLVWASNNGILTIGPTAFSNAGNWSSFYPGG